MKKLILGKLFAFGMFLSGGCLGEAFVYVSDQIEIPIRTEKSIDAPILRMAFSGEKLALLESTESGWTKIRLSNNHVGWINSRFVINELPAREQLEKLSNQYNIQQIEYNKQTQAFKSLQKSLKESQEIKNTLAIEKAKIESRIKHIEKTYEDALKIEHSNQTLQQKILQLKNEMQILKKSNTYEQDRNARNWFVVGGLVLLIGVIFGVLTGRKYKRKRYY